MLIDELRFVRAEDGYRHALDPFLLSSFVVVSDGDVVVDLGTAAGILPLLISVTSSVDKIIGVELQARLVEQAQENVELNELLERIEIIHADLRDIAPGKILPHESYDVVVSNPPYRRPNTGKIATDEERAACRHELNGDICDFIDTAFYLLKNKGRLSLVYLPERLPELLGVMQQRKIEPKRMRFVYTKVGADAVLVLVEGRKNSKPGLMIESPLFIYENDEYSREVKKILRMVDS